MAELFTSGRIIDFILILVALESLALVLWRARTGKGPAFGAVWPMLLAGCFLLLAVRFALVDAPWPWIAAALLAGGVVHVVDLARR